MTTHLKSDKGSGKTWLYTQGSYDVTQANEFLKTLQIRGMSPDTLRSYGYDLVAFYRWLPNLGKDVASLTPQDFIDFVDKQRQAGLAPRSLNRRLTTVQSFWRFCGGSQANGQGAPYVTAHYRGRGRDRNLGLHRCRQPKHRLLQVKIPHTLVEPLTVEQVQMFLRTLSRYRDLCIVYLMLFCGLRSREVLHLRLHDVSFEERQVRVHGKGNKQRILPLPTSLLTALTKYLKHERPAKGTSQLLFLVLQGKRKGEAMTPSGLRTLFRYRRRKPSLCNANAHRWRHTFGTDMARAGTTLPVLQRLMGHSDMRVTLQYINLSMADIAGEFQQAAKVIQQRYKKAAKT
jgi:integrase/recombinase XerD